MRDQATQHAALRAFAGVTLAVPEEKCTGPSQPPKNRWKKDISISRQAPKHAVVRTGTSYGAHAGVHRRGLRAIWSETTPGIVQDPAEGEEPEATGSELGVNKADQGA